MTNLKEELRALIAEIAEKDEIPDDVAFKDLGIDSMMGVEIVAAIERKYQVKIDDAELVEELGDVLYQVIFHSDIAAEEGRFTLEDVAAHMTAKMVGRHPHVCGDAGADTPDDVMARWDELKRVEKPGRESVLDGIPQGMPALALAAKLVGRAEKVGLAPRAADPVAASEEELGDELLATVVAARAAGLDPERALRDALRRLQDDIRKAEEPPQDPARAR